MSERIRLTIDIDGDKPPSEFRLLKAGINTTADGREYMFDSTDAAAVMVALGEHGVDRMIDLEHLSIDQEARHYDPDARAWCKTELRAGELWAAGVQWLEDGARRLGAKLQRYVSPYLEIENGHVVRLINIAMTALPALNGTPALVAARVHLPPLDAARAATSSLAHHTAALAVGDRTMPESATIDMAAIAAACQTCAEACAACAEACRSGTAEEAINACAACMPACEECMAACATLAPGAATAAAPPAEKAAEMTAAASVLARLSGTSSLGESVRAAQEWHASHVELTAERAKLATERAALELGQRKANAAQLVKLGAETPHTSGLATGVLCSRLATEPLAEQSARVSALLAARGGQLPAAPVPPTSADAHGLDARELAICAEQKCDPATFVALRRKLRPLANA